MASSSGERGKSAGPARCLFFGNGSPAIICLEKLISKDCISDVLVVAPPDGRVRGWNASLKAYCDKKRIRCISPDDVNSKSAVRIFRDFGPDLIFSVYYTQVLSERILRLARYAVNFHPSLLPKYRGTSPYVRAVANGERWTAVTAHRMTASVDKGAIYAVKRIPVKRSETGYMLYEKLVPVCAAVFESVLSGLRKGVPASRPFRGKSSYYSSKTPPLNRLKPGEQSKERIYNIVRSLSSPFINAYVRKGGRKYLIDRVSIVRDRRLAGILERIGERRGCGLFSYGGTMYIRAADGFLRLERYRAV